LRPLVSVILPVFNGEKTIRQAIDSILNQSLIDFELIVINDGSTDRTREILSSLLDNRIRIYNTVNRGLVNALNFGLENAFGKFIARQDADDYSHPHRLKKQVEYLLHNRDVILLGTRATIIDENGMVVGMHQHPTSNFRLSFALIFSNPFVHSSIMFHADESIRYSQESCVSPPEDYELWLRFATKGNVANLPEALIQYTDLYNSLSKKEFNLYSKRMQEASFRRLRVLLKDLPINDDELRDFISYMFMELGISVSVSKLFKVSYYILQKIKPRCFLDLIYVATNFFQISFIRSKTKLKNIILK